MPKIASVYLTMEDLINYTGGMGGSVDVTVHAPTHLVGATDPLSVGVPVDIGGANAEGAATNFARRDHVHEHAAALGGDLHHPQLHAASHEPGGGDLIDALTFSNQGLHILDLGADHDLIIKPGTDLSANRILTLTTGDAARTITLSGNPTLANWFDQSVKQASSPRFVNPRVDTLRLDDTGNDHYLSLILNENLGANRTLNLIVGNATRTITLSGNPTLADWFDQNLKQAASPTFVTAKLTALTDGYIPYHVNDGAGLADSPIINFGGNIGINVADPDEQLEVNGNVKATEFLGALHWDNITNEPAFYPPEYHYHVGKDIVSTHLVDLDDVDADDIFDVLATGNIHGLGNYDWFGTWDVLAGAGCTVEVVVLAGDDKYLSLEDLNGATRATVTLTAVADHPMVISAIQFQVRQSANNKEGVIFFRGFGNNIYILMADDGDIKLFDGTGLTTLQAYAANTWYTIRIYCDCVARAAVVFVENVYKTRKAITLEYIDEIFMRTKNADTGYTLDINNLKIFNLTV